MHLFFFLHSQDQSCAILEQLPRPCESFHSVQVHGLPDQAVERRLNFHLAVSKTLLKESVKKQEGEKHLL